MIFGLVLVTIGVAAGAMFLTARSVARRLGAVTTAIRAIVAEDMTQLVEIANTLAKGDCGGPVLGSRSLQDGQ